MRQHRASTAAAIDELATAALERCGVPVPRKRSRRVKAALEALDELAARASAMARSSTHRARQATVLALGVADALAAAPTPTLRRLLSTGPRVHARSTGGSAS